VPEYFRQEFYINVYVYVYTLTFPFADGQIQTLKRIIVWWRHRLVFRVMKLRQIWM